MSFGALAKNGSFGFAKGRLVCRAKPNVPFVRLAKIELKKSAVGKNKKYRRVGKECRLTCCPFVILSVCFGHLSKWFTFSVKLSACRWLLCRPLRLHLSSFLVIVLKIRIRKFSVRFCLQVNLVFVASQLISSVYFSSCAS
jgi:hypothetical protein